MVPEPGIDDRLIEQARRGLLLLQTDGDLTEWIRESGSLLREVDVQLHRVGAAASETVAVGRSAPAFECPRAVPA